MYGFFWIHWKRISKSKKGENLCEYMQSLKTEEDTETYISLMDLLRSELKDYSKEDFYDSLCYLVDKTSKTKDDLEKK